MEFSDGDCKITLPILGEGRAVITLAGPEGKNTARLFDIDSLESRVSFERVFAVVKQLQSHFVRSGWNEDPDSRPLSAQRARRELAMGANPGGTFSCGHGRFLLAMDRNPRNAKYSYDLLYRLKP